MRDPVLVGYSPNPSDYPSCMPFHEGHGVCFISSPIVDELSVTENPSSQFVEEIKNNVIDETHKLGKIIVIGNSRNTNLNAAIAALLCSKHVLAPIAYAQPWETCWQETVEWPWTPLHYKLSQIGTQEKEKRVQQRRAALFKLHEKKRLKKGRSHAKQKHKSVKEY